MCGKRCACSLLLVAAAHTPEHLHLLLALLHIVAAAEEQVQDAGQIHPAATTYQAYCGPHPRAVMIKTLNAVVIDRAVMGPRRLVEMARVIVANLKAQAKAEHSGMQCKWRSNQLQTRYR